MTRRAEFSEFIDSEYEVKPTIGEECESDDDLRQHPPGRFFNVLAMRQVG